MGAAAIESMQNPGPLPEKTSDIIAIRDQTIVRIRESVTDADKIVANRQRLANALNRLSRLSNLDPQG